MLDLYIVLTLLLSKRDTKEKSEIKISNWTEMMYQKDVFWTLPSA